ncbi:MAG: DUF3788 domain-containing protein [Bacteroidales bacterium]
MSDISIFTDKEIKPSEESLKTALNSSFIFWEEIRQLVFSKYPGAVEEWNYPGKKYGWSFRMKDKKRAIIYFLPREGYFKVAFVFGDRALDKILNSSIRNTIKEELQNARKYAEGRGISIEVKDREIIGDINKLIEVKLAF